MPTKLNEEEYNELYNEIKEKVLAEEKAKKKKPKKSKEPKKVLTEQVIYENYVKTRTYDHLGIDDRYPKWLSILEKSPNIYLDFETHTPDYIMPYELVEKDLKEKNYGGRIKGLYTTVKKEIESRPLDPFKGKIRLMQLGDEEHEFIFDWYRCTEEDRLRIRDIIQNKYIIGQNIMFEFRYVCTTWGPDYLPEHCYDTMTIDKLIWCSQNAFMGATTRFDLQTIAERRCGIYIAKGHGGDDWGVPEINDEQFKYAAEDITILRPICKAQLEELKKMGNKFVHLDKDVDKELPFLSGLRNIHLIADIENCVIPCFARMMHVGIPVRMDVLEQWIKDSDEKFEKAQAELGFNPNSSQQVLDVLVNQYNINVPGSSSEVLAPYKEQYEIVAKILEARSISTVNGLVKGYIEAANKYGDGRVHPNFTVYQAYSGRTACKEPNCQQVPRQIKKKWMKPDKGKVILSADYPAIELRLAAAYTQEKVMIDAFAHNKDLHKITASMTAGVPIEEVTDSQRKAAKTVNFGFIYGCSAKAFKKKAMEKFGVDYSLEQSQEFRDKFFEAYKDMDRHVRKMFKLFPFGQTGVQYVIKTLLGRRMMVDRSTNALNYPIQGSGADAAKLSVIYLYHILRHYKNGKYLGKIEPISFVHDEVFMEGPANKEKFMIKLIKKSLGFGINYMLGDFFHVDVDVEEDSIHRE